METMSFIHAIETLPVTTILWILLGGMVIVFGVYSSILLWHWNKYSTGKFTTVTNMFVYLGVSGGFILIMLLSIFWFSLV